MAAHLLTRTGAATGSANQLAAASGTDGRASAGPVVLTTAIEGERARLLAILGRNGGRPVIALAGTSTGIAQAATSRARAPTLAAAPLAAAAAGLARRAAHRCGASPGGTDTQAAD
jgi:hypothetical protein